MNPTTMSELRQVDFETSAGVYRLETWDSGSQDWRGQTVIGYRLALNEEVLFEGEDFSGSPLHADDSDETVQAIMHFLTLRPGDTDDRYFSRYTSEQLAWSEDCAEELAFVVEQMSSASNEED